MLDRQRQLDQSLHRSVRTQHRVRGLEERIRAGVKELVELDPKAGEDIERLARGRVDRETHTQRPFSRVP